MSAILVDILLKTIKIHDSGDENGIDISPEMTTIGKIDVFDETLESWETYVERVQHFFAANDVDEDHKVPTLLSLIGSKTYSLLKDLLLPEKSADKTFDEIVSTLQKHLNPTPLEIAERFRFISEISKKVRAF